jgi:hypothetical protein
MKTSSALYYSIIISLIIWIIQYRVTCGVPFGAEDSPTTFVAWIDFGIAFLGVSIILIYFAFTVISIGLVYNCTLEELKEADILDKMIVYSTFPILFKLLHYKVIVKILD